MKQKGFIKINRWLLPASWLYGMGVALRNRLFDWGVLKSKQFDVPVISVGNLTVGGTGKTPHVEYLIRLLKDRAQVAVLSRGYKRKTKGYLLATAESTQQDIGDEPYQMKHKFPDIHVAVDANRCDGITHLTTDEETKDTDIILLDDAFQHRYVKPALSILLVDHNRLITHDALLPAGRLREPVSGKKRAQIVIVTKCPKKLMPLDFRVLTKSLNLRPFQSLFFTTLQYGRLKGVFTAEERELESVRKHNVLLLTGIASPQQIMKDLQSYELKATELTFADHHDFTASDEETIEQAFHSLPEPRIIITTEKDATRMTQFTALSEETRQHLFALPIRVSFLQDQETSFNEKILSYVRKDSTNSSVAEVKDDVKPQNSDNTGLRPRTISFRNF